MINSFVGNYTDFLKVLRHSIFGERPLIRDTPKDAVA